MPIPSPRLATGVFLTLAAIQPASAGSSNRLGNPGFDTDIAGWSSGQPELVLAWDSTDAAGSPASGSLRARVESEVAVATTTLRCLGEVTPGTALDAGARGLAAAEGAGVDDAPPGTITFQLLYFAAPDCGGGTVGSRGLALQVRDAWTALQIAGYAAPASAVSVGLQLGLAKTSDDERDLVARFDDLYVVPAGSCHPSGEVLCIDDVAGDGRFAVQARYATSSGGGRFGNGIGIPLDSLGVARGGLLWFFNPANPELLVKILDGCPVNDHRWVFFSAGTNVGFELTVEDTATETIRTYSNPDLMAALPVQDTEAFACD